MFMVEHIVVAIENLLRFNLEIETTKDSLMKKYLSNLVGLGIRVYQENMLDLEMIQLLT